MLQFLDSALTDEIASGLEHWRIDGVTTNPRHAAVFGAHIVTAGADVIRDSMSPPDTALGERFFGEARDGMPTE